MALTTRNRQFLAQDASDEFIESFLTSAGLDPTDLENSRAAFRQLLALEDSPEYSEATETAARFADSLAWGLFEAVVRQKHERSGHSPERRASRIAELGNYDDMEALRELVVIGDMELDEFHAIVRESAPNWAPEFLTKLDSDGAYLGSEPEAKIELLGEVGYLDDEAHRSARDKYLERDARYTLRMISSGNYRGGFEATFRNRADELVKLGYITPDELTDAFAADQQAQVGYRAEKEALFATRPSAIDMLEPDEITAIDTVVDLCRQHEITCRVDDRALVFSHSPQIGGAEFARLSDDGQISQTGPQPPTGISEGILDPLSEILSDTAIGLKDIGFLPLVVCPRQIDLKDRPTNLIQDFLEGLAELGLGRTRFLRASPTGSRFADDGGMDVATFKNLMNEGSGLVHLATKARVSNGAQILQPDEIWFAVMMTYDGDDEVGVRVECELTRDNYQNVAKVFERVFGADMRETLDTGHHV